MEVCITYPTAGSANRADVAEDEEEEVNVQGLWIIGTFVQLLIFCAVYIKL